MKYARHGKSHSRVYNIWALMLQRCTNPKAANYISYGGAGVTVCDRWYDFALFYEDMGDPPTPEHTLDRIDNDVGYCMGNCRWADRDTQQNNRTNVRKITAFGETLGAGQWARKLGMSYEMVQHRVFILGMPPEEALRTPKMSHVKRPLTQKSTDGHVVAQHDSLVAAARAQAPGDYERFKKSLWALLKRGNGAAEFAGYYWEYVESDSSK